MNVSNFLHQTASRIPNQIAFYDKQNEITYRELSETVKELSNLLQEKGIGEYCGVGVMGNNSIHFVAMAFAVMEVGAVVMPIASYISDDELKEILNSAKLHYLLDDNTHPITLPELKNNSSIKLPAAWRLWKTESVSKADRFASHVPNAALVRFTSGTTGTSKGVILSHNAIDERTTGANIALKLNETDKVMWVLSMAYHFVVSIILYIRYGCKVIINHDFLASVMLNEINKHKATFLYASPMHIRLLSGDTSGIQMSSLRRVISTSTGISKQQCELFQNRFGIAVSQAYGIIEIGLPVINIEKSAESPDAIGFAVSGYDVEILDENNKPLPANSTGHLAIRGPGMFDAYLNPPQLRNDILNDSWFMTGDLATKNEDGLISVVGRKKSVINTAGNKVFPEEVEFILNEHTAIESSRVSGYTHKLLGEGVQAEIVFKSGEVNPGVEELRSYCKKRLSSYKVPQKIIVVEKLTMTSSGKIKR